MNSSKTHIFVQHSPIQEWNQPPTGAFVELFGETYYRIANVDQMPTFFMSVVSGADHWLFVASNGGLTAGRRDSDSALFPYETEDKIAAHHELTGSKTMVRMTRNGRTQLWEPFSNRYAGIYQIERNLYKNIYGNKLVFEEINHSLNLMARISWRTSARYGFVRSGWLQNSGRESCQIDLLDGVQNVLPYGTTQQVQTNLSSLLQAYKRSELEPETGLGIFALSATLTDRAEPSESLKATVVWQVGLAADCHLLSTQQIEAFRYGRSLTCEHDICGAAGSYLVTSSFTLEAGQQKEWHLVADVNQDSAAITRLIGVLKQDQATIIRQLEADIEQGTKELLRYVAAADGLQMSAQETTVAHHYANVLFNIMRGGIFANGYQVEKHDFLDFVYHRNRVVFHAQRDWFAGLPELLDIRDLYTFAAQANKPDLIRLCFEYLPLTFSRRHGDPSRPWNRFSINLKKPDGSQNLDYQGNWRDIFQNWEPLVLAFPAYTEGMIAKFLNATTADGYNPYRLTRDGIEWELLEPDNPWANIGYWSDHQIIYLQKLLEIAEHVQPGSLAYLWNRPIFAYANVPYRLRPYEEMLKDWYNTIDFDWEGEEATEAAVAQMGTDGRLLRDASGNVIHVTMIEKLLVLLLAKLTNFVPDGGIWMNTQRPEWNDANNALVGKGISVVTAAYLRRFIAFWRQRLVEAEDQEFRVNTAVADLFTQVQAAFSGHYPHLHSGFGDRERRAIMDELGAAATAYRATIYANGLPAAHSAISGQSLQAFLALAQDYVEHTLRANRRSDGMYHAYNVLLLGEGTAAIDHLYPMLEGQVAILSAGLLSPEESLTLLQSLRHSDLYRADQHSYMLYPYRQLPGFLQKNNVPADKVAGSPLVQALAANGDGRLLAQDEVGVFHFNGRFRNANDAARVLDELAQEPAYAELVAAERTFILDLFEQTFNHRAFTGRSGTFFAYEGLGSIYWHMVSKLLLAAQESYLAAWAAGAETAVLTALADAYYDIRAGLGFNKSPVEYGAFPTDPYSHTPWGSGARQPGMTGMVKEEILTRLGELGVFVRNGQLCFEPVLLRPTEFLAATADYEYVDVAGVAQRMTLPAGTLAFTFCQTPIVYQQGAVPQVEVMWADGRFTTHAGSQLDVTTTRHIFNRDGQVKRLLVTLIRPQHDFAAAGGGRSSAVIFAGGTYVQNPL